MRHSTKTRLHQMIMSTTVCGFVAFASAASIETQEPAPVAADPAPKAAPAPAAAPKAEEAGGEAKADIAEALKKAVDPKRAETKTAEQTKKETDQAKKDADEAQIKAFLPQFEQQIRPLVRSRYNFLRAVADPNKEQRAKIVKAAEEIQNSVVRTYAELQLKMQTGLWTADSKYPNGNQVVSERFLALAKEFLNPEQLARYNEEVRKKTVNYKAVCVKNLVVSIDNQLVLSADQREKIAADLTEHWEDGWISSLEVFMYGDQFLPQLPDKLILAHLNDLQKEVWKGTPRNGGMIWGGLGFMWGNQPNDGPLDQDFPDARKSEPAPAVEAQDLQKNVDVQSR